MGAVYFVTHRQKKCLGLCRHSCVLLMHNFTGLHTLYSYSVMRKEGVGCTGAYSAHILYSSIFSEDSDRSGTRTAPEHRTSTPPPGTKCTTWKPSLYTKLPLALLFFACLYAILSFFVCAGNNTVWKYFCPSCEGSRSSVLAHGGEETRRRDADLQFPKGASIAKEHPPHPEKDPSYGRRVELGTHKTVGQKIFLVCGKTGKSNRILLHAFVEQICNLKWGARLV